jgi:hypothetical protein
LQLQVSLAKLSSPQLLVLEVAMVIPIPQYSAKTRLGELYTPEIFVVMLIRVRVATMIDPTSVHEDWRAGLRAAGVANEGADAFDLLMHLLGPVPHLSLDVRSLRCAGLGEGEALLLQTVSLLQRDLYDEAENILGRWLPPGVSRVATLQAQRFARALAATHLTVPVRDSAAERLPVYLPPTADRGLSLVH